MRTSKAPCLLGQVFGRLTVISRAENDKRGNAAWHCRCSCGAERRVLAQSLRVGATQSCGCLNKEIVSRNGITHGRSGSLDYKSWHAMIQRCTNPKHWKWPRYGGRGISVCERWLKFENFLEDMGERPVGLTIDRIDNDGNYEPGNCRWATQLTQGSNRGNNRRFQIDGNDLTLSQAARKYGISLVTIRSRLRAGWPAEEAIKTPAKPQRGTRNAAAF